MNKWIFILIVLVLCGCDEKLPQIQTGNDAEEDSVNTATVTATASETFYEGPMYVFERAGKTGYMNIYGDEIIAPQFDDARDFSENLAAAAKDGKWGFINRNGHFIIDPFYSEVSDFSEGLAVIYINNKAGYIQSDGVIHIEPKYTSAYPFKAHFAVVEMQNNYGLIDREGHYVLSPRYPMVMPVSEERVMVLDSTGYFGYTDTTGQFIVKPFFEKAWPYAEGKAPVKGEKGWGYLNLDGQFTLNVDAESAWTFSEGKALVYKKGKWGYIDTTGKDYIPPMYDDAYPYKEGMAAVKKGDKWGYIDLLGREVIAFQYENYGSFRDGLARIATDSGYYYIDTKGKVVEPFDKGKPTIPIENTEPPVIENPGLDVAPKMKAITTFKAWERGKVPLARYIAKYMAETWNGDPLLIVLGQHNGRYTLIQAHTEGKEIKAEMVIVNKDKEYFRNDLVGPGLYLGSNNAEAIRQKVLNNLWHWDGEGILKHRQLRKFTLSKHADQSVGVGEGSAAFNLSFDGQKWTKSEPL